MWISADKPIKHITTMKVGKDKVVAVSYELKVEGKTADKAGSEAPL